MGILLHSTVGPYFICNDYISLSTGELRRKIGARALDVEANAILG